MHVKTAKYYRSIDLEDLTEAEYCALKERGLLWEYFPEATNEGYHADMKRIDKIGQNGNDGAHYQDIDLAPEVDYRVSGDDNPDGVNIDWPHETDDDYATKIEKLYDLPKDNMFVDDYVPCRGHDMVDSPRHYYIGDTGLEAIDVIDAVLDTDWLTPKEGYVYGNILKYLLRAPNKNQLEDLRKAHKYLNWLIESLGE